MKGLDMTSKQTTPKDNSSTYKKADLFMYEKIIFNSSSMPTKTLTPMRSSQILTNQR